MSFRPTKEGWFVFELDFHETVYQYKCSRYVFVSRLQRSGLWDKLSSVVCADLTQLYENSDFFGLPYCHAITRVSTFHHKKSYKLQYNISTTGHHWIHK